MFAECRLTKLLNLLEGSWDPLLDRSADQARFDPKWLGRLTTQPFSSEIGLTGKWLWRCSMIPARLICAFSGRSSLLPPPIHAKIT